MKRISGLVNSNDVAIVAYLKEVDIALMGVLHDSWKTVSGTTSTLTYREYIKIKSVFLLKAHEMLSSLIKAIELNDSFKISAEDVLIDSTKFTSIEDAKIAVNCIIQAALGCAIGINNKMSIESVLSPSTRKFLEMLEKIEFIASLGDTDFVKFVSIANSFNIDLNLSQVSIRKSAQIKNAVNILSDINGSLRKYLIFGPSVIELRSIIDVALIKYRKLLELSGLDLSDVADWTFKEFYMISEE